MKRILVAGLGLGACAAAVLSAGIAPAASPAVESAIKAIEAVGSDPGKLKLFCEINKLLQSAGDSGDEAAQKQVEDMVAQLGPDFSAAWDAGDELDESSEDGQEFYAAVDSLAEKCE